MEILNMLPQAILVDKLDKTGDSAENTVTFETADAAEANVWTDVDVLTSGEKHKSILKKVSTMFKNVRYLYKMLGTTDISALGDGTCTGAIAAQNDALTWKLCGTGTGHNILKLPETYNELSVDIGPNAHSKIHITKFELTEAIRPYRCGYYRNAGQCAFFQFACSLTHIYLQAVYANGTTEDTSDLTNITVYYR